MSQKQNNTSEGCASPGRNQKGGGVGCAPPGELQLSPSEIIILHLIQQDYYASSETLAMRYKAGTTGQYIRKVRGKLHRLGLVAPPMVATPGDSATTATKTRRLHAVKLRIELVRPISEKYLRVYNKKIFTLKGCNIQCFSECICIQATQKSFWGVTEDEALDAAMAFFYPLFGLLEHDMGTILLKERKANISMTYDEWATNPSSTATEVVKRGKQIRIYDDEGKLRFTTDRSMGFEHEAHSAITGKQDSENYNKHVADFLDHKEAPTLSELAKLVGALVVQNTETAAGLKSVITLLQPIKPKEVALEKPGYII